MLSHLVYVSTRKPSCTEEEIQKILASCKKNNANIDITGVLLYSDTQFVQYLEGEYKTIISLYDKIKDDNRHKNAILITSAPIAERAFPSWQMGSRKFSTDLVDFKSEIDEQSRKTFNDILSGKTEGTQKAAQIIRKFFK